MKIRNRSMARVLAVLILLPFLALADGIVMGIAESGGSSVPLWERACVANGFTKIPAEWPGGSIVTKSSGTNALILLSARQFGGNAVEVEAISAIDGHTIRVDRFDSRSLTAETMSKTLNSIVATFDLPADNSTRLTVVVYPLPRGNLKQEQLNFSFRSALAGATNMCLLPENKLRHLAVGLQDFVMANHIQMRTPVVGRMLPADVLLKPDLQAKVPLSYIAVDTTSGLPLETIAISGESDIPKALVRIQTYRIEGNAEPQNRGYSPPAARPAQPTP